MRDRKQLRPEHEEFAILVADPSDRRPLEEKAEACGFSRPHAWRMLKHPDIAAMIARYADENMQLYRAQVAQVMQVLREQALGGELKAIDLYLEASGVIGRGANVVTNVTQVAGGEELGDAIARIRRERLAGAHSE